VSRRTKALLAGALIVLLVLGAVLAFVLYRRHQGRNIRGSSTVEFVPTQTVPRKPPPPGVVWPTFGYDDARLRVGPFHLQPPYRAIWTFRARSLVEFPPAVAFGRLYVATNDGRFFALSARTGKVDWQLTSHRCVAASPAVSRHVVYETFLNRPPCNASGSDLDGEVVALDADTGDVRWRVKLAPTESSPLVAGGRVYVGDWSGAVVALDAQTGKRLWSYTTGGKVKGALALAGGRLYAGSYDGHLYAFAPATGRLLWRAASQPRLNGLGTFYSTPAAAYDRVYLGSTDGKVYSYGAASGELRWSHGTGSYVYGSPAVWHQLVLVGSYDGTFYAFDAATGDTRWTFSANGPISGSATVLDGIVYFATLKERTYALDAATGKQVWSWPDGKYTPVVADARRLYLVGYARVYGMVPR